MILRKNISFDLIFPCPSVDSVAIISSFIRLRQYWHNNMINDRTTGRP